MPVCLERNNAIFNTNIVFFNTNIVLYDTNTAFSIEILPNTAIFYTNLVKFFKECSDSYVVYGTFLEGQDSKAVNIKPNSILVIGNESHGISDALKQFIDTKITIKKFSDHIDSLNAATATSILLYEFSK